MASKIQIRRDTVENWNLVAGSVILGAGEIGYETNTRNLKIGDGTSVWSALKYQAPVYSGTNSTLAAATLAVDQTNNRVGIGTASPQAKLHTAVLGPTNGIVEIVQNTAGVTGSQIQITQSTIQDWAIGQPAATDAFAFWRGRNTSAGGDEFMRIGSTGRVGIGQSSPTAQLDVNGNVTSNRTTAGTFVVSGDGVYAFGADTKQYIYGTSGNSGTIGIFASNAGGTSAQVLSVTSTGAAVTGSFNATGLTAGTNGLASGGGITLTSGALTLNAGTTTSFPAGSIAGAAIADNGVTVAKLAQLATLTVLGNSTGATATPAALTSGVAGTAKTALGLSNVAYNSAIYKLSESGLIGLVLANTSPPAVNVTITSNLVDVEYWYRVTSTSTASGGPRTAQIYFNAPATNGLVVNVESNFGVGTATLTTSSGTSYGNVFAASAQALVTLSNASLAGVSQCWISVKKIVIT